MSVSEVSVALGLDRGHEKIRYHASGAALARIPRRTTGVTVQYVGIMNRLRTSEGRSRRAAPDWKGIASGGRQSLLSTG
jgi:hypothetical protein